MLSVGFWANYFKVYDNLSKLVPYKRLLTDIADELDIKSGDVTLEAGCGTGNLCLELKDRGAKVIGVDFVKEALDNYSKKDASAITVQHDLAKPLPFSDCHFDRIASNNVMYTLPQDKQIDLIREFHRVLKPNGLLVITNQQSTKFSLLELFKFQVNAYRGINKIVGALRFFFNFGLILPFDALIKVNLDRGVYQYIDKDQLAAAMSDIGFSIVKIGATYANQNFLIKAQK